MRILAICTLLTGSVIVFVSHRDWVIRSIGLLVITLGVYLLQNAGKGKSSSTNFSDGKLVDAQVGAGRKPSRVKFWIVGVILLIEECVALILLYIDSENGGQSVGIVYFFAGSTVVVGGFWSFFVGLLYRDKFI